MKPIVKWQGGKSQLLNEIHKRIPEDTKRIIEPFVGGGAICFEVLSKYDLQEIFSSIQRITIHDG